VRDDVDNKIAAFVEGVLEHTGLPPARRAEVREELCGHLRDAVEAAVARGREPDEALETALTDFGPASPVRRGLRLGQVARLARSLLKPGEAAAADRAVAWICALWGVGFLYLYAVLLSAAALPVLVIALAALAIAALASTGLWRLARRLVGGLCLAWGVCFLSLFVLTAGPGYSVLIAGVLAAGVGALSLSHREQRAAR
jgi:hypothetical protein